MLTAADTAYSIAAVRADEALLPSHDRLFDDPYAAAFRASGAHAEAGTQRYLSLPFFRDGIRLRTRFLDDELLDALAAGIDQVVLLGAGFDARALRIAEIAARGTRVYEIDLAEQLARKRAVLAAAGVELPAWVAYVACDLTAADFEDALGRALDGVGFRRDRAAIVLWEGVTTYIGVAATQRTLRLLASLGAPGTRVVFDFGANVFHPGDVVEHVVRAGFSSCESIGGDDLWRRYLPGEPHASAGVFRIAVARR